MKSRTRTVTLTLAAALLAGTVGATAVLAQDSPECPLPPVSVPLWDGTPPAAILATPVATGDPVEIDEAEIERAVADIVACMNTGEPQLVFAIYTDRFLASQYADPDAAYLPEFEQRLAENAPEPANQFTLQAVEEIEALDDGRVQVIVVLTAGDTTFSDTLVLAQQDGVWLIDEIASLDPDA